VKSERNFLVKPAKVPYLDTEDEGELLIHVSPQVWRKGFTVAIHHGNTSEVLHKVDQDVLLKLDSSHVDRQSRKWYAVKTPLKAHSGGLSRLTAVLYYDNGPMEGETRQVTFVKAPPTDSRVVHVDHKLDAVLDLYGLPMIITGMYTHGVDELYETLIPNLEAPHGFNTILAYITTEAVNITAILAFLDRCHQVGINYILEVGEFCEKHTSEEVDWNGLEKLILATRDHPALLGYYLADEPAGAGIPENILRESYEFIKELDPYHPVFMVFCCVNPAEYELDYDIGMVDPYPVPNGPPASISGLLDELAAVGKPFALVPQAFGGGEWWWRTPTPLEVRMMTYLALVKGASGFIFFIYGPRYIPYSTSLWSECRNLALEALDISASLLGGKPPLTVTVLEPGVEAVGFQNRLNVYDVIIVNTNSTPVMYLADVHTSVSDTAEVRFETRQVKIDGGLVQGYLGSYGVSVLRFPQPQSSPSPNNLIFNPSFELVSSAATPDAAYLGVEKDMAASYLADPRVSYDGLYSVRLTSPEPGVGYAPSGYPFGINPGMYELSAYLYSHTPGVKVQFNVAGPLHPQGPTLYTVQSPDKWEKFSVSVNCTQSGRGQYLSYELVSNGTVWIDFHQLVPS
jgi:hypothetical protein